MGYLTSTNTRKPLNCCGCNGLQRDVHAYMHTHIHIRNYSMYNNLVYRCFDGCVGSFRSKTLDGKEIVCVENCAARFVKMTQRVGLRFAEHQAMQQKRAADAAS
jgi:hypothetical protein